MKDYKIEKRTIGGRVYYSCTLPINEQGKRRKMYARSESELLAKIENKTKKSIIGG